MTTLEDLRSNRLAELADRWKPVPVVRVSYCGQRGVWDWSVVVDGQTIASGSEKTEAEARTEAQAVRPSEPATTSILITGGIGDAIAVESLMWPEERERLGTIYYAAPSAREIAELFRALPNFPRLQNHLIVSSGSAVHWSKDTVTNVPPETEDWSIGNIFRQHRHFTGSSFLTHRIASPELPPSPYVVVVPVSTFGQWPGRAFDDNDWQECLTFISDHRLYGVVLNRDSSPLPNHPRLIGWQTRTSICESIEILKAAVGYLGIDSSLSVLATKLFPASRICVKSVQPHLHAWKHVYYLPRLTFGFIHPNLRAPSWI